MKRFLIIAGVALVALCFIAGLWYYNLNSANFPVSRADAINTYRFEHDGEFIGSTQRVVWDDLNGYWHQDYFFISEYLGPNGQYYPFHMWMNGRTGEIEKVILPLPNYWPNQNGM